MKWIDVEKVQPKEFEDVLVVVRISNINTFMIGFFGKSGWCLNNYPDWINAKWINAKVLYWMPLPDMP